MIRILHKCFLKQHSLELLRPMSTKLDIKKPRYNGRSKKRKWEDRRSDKGEGLYSEKVVKTDENFVRVKRRKYAMLLGYSGADYFGMQRNPFSKTIEEDLCKALLKAELITEEAYNQMQTIQFQRAARTDKGVSAAKQVVSLKLPEVVDLEKVNSFLPETIRVFAAKRVTKGFNSKGQCNARTYMYMLPSIALSDSAITLYQEGYHLSDERHGEVNALLKQFEGTHNYHSYTNKKKPNDPSAKRYIMSFHCEKPFVREGIEFVILKVKGQSFMLHQIRKMVGITVAVLRGYTTQEILDKSFTTEKVNIPRAPGLGLVLEEVHYDQYNCKYGTDGIHETLDWKECEDEINEFKEKYIFPTIINTEVKERPFINWMEGRLLNHDFNKIEEEISLKTEENAEDDEEQSSDEECEEQSGKEQEKKNREENNSLSHNSKCEAKI